MALTWKLGSKETVRSMKEFLNLTKICFFTMLVDYNCCLFPCTFPGILNVVPGEKSMAIIYIKWLLIVTTTSDEGYFGRVFKFG